MPVGRDAGLGRGGHRGGVVHDGTCSSSSTGLRIAELLDMGFTLVATRGTARVLEGFGLPVTPINKVREGRPHIVDAMKNGEVQLVFNTTDGTQALQKPLRSAVPPSP